MTVGKRKRKPKPLNIFHFDLFDDKNFEKSPIYRDLHFELYRQVYDLALFIFKNLVFDLLQLFEIELTHKDISKKDLLKVEVVKEEDREQIPYMIFHRYMDIERAQGKIVAFYEPRLLREIKAYEEKED